MMIGVILIVFGIAILAYKGFNYTQHEKIAQLGNVQITSDTQKTIYFSPILGGVSLVAGIFLVVIMRKTKD